MHSTVPQVLTGGMEIFLFLDVILLESTSAFIFFYIFFLFPNIKNLRTPLAPARTNWRVKSAPNSEKLIPMSVPSQIQNLLMPLLMLPASSRPTGTFPPRRIFCRLITCASRALILLDFLILSKRLFTRR